MKNIGGIDKIKVHYCSGSAKVPMGLLVNKNRKIFFEYDPSFLETGLELSPFKLPLKPGLISCEDSVFDGLFGVFNDSLPDGWGRLLLDRKLLNLGINPDQLTPLDRLSYIGQQGMGALFYEPVISGSSLFKLPDLDQIAEECLQFQRDDNEAFVDELLVMNGSSAGARPKILVSFTDHSYEISNNHISRYHDDWIIKLISSLDPKDIGPIEYAYHLMAKEAGLNVPEAKLFESKNCPGYFGVKRFDRVGKEFIHMHSLSGLIHFDHRIPTLDYHTIMKVTQWLTKDENEKEKQFRNTVFNILSHNRDDHAKNFSFLMDRTGRWTVSPAYDLTFSWGPGGEHSTVVMGEGKKPELKHLIKLAKENGIRETRAVGIIEQVKNAVIQWKKFAKDAGVSPKSTKMIKSTLDELIRKF